HWIFTVSWLAMPMFTVHWVDVPVQPAVPVHDRVQEVFRSRTTLVSSTKYQVQVLGVTQLCPLSGPVTVQPFGSGPTVTVPCGASSISSRLALWCTSTASRSGP